MRRGRRHGKSVEGCVAKVLDAPWRTQPTHPPSTTRSSQGMHKKFSRLRRCAGRRVYVKMIRQQEAGCARKRPQRRVCIPRRQQRRGPAFLSTMQLAGEDGTLPICVAPCMERGPRTLVAVVATAPSCKCRHESTYSSSHRWPLHTTSRRRRVQNPRDQTPCHTSNTRSLQESLLVPACPGSACQWSMDQLANGSLAMDESPKAALLSTNK